MAAVVGVDVGGTFTDFIGYDSSTGTLVIDKRPTTLDDQSVAVAEAMGAFGRSLETVDQVVHGTTTATNAIIERRGARCALVTTTGMRDVLECGRRDRPSVYGLRGAFEPLVPREARFEVGGRLDRLGEEIEPLSADDLGQVAELVSAGGFDAVAVSLMHSYANADHEAAVEEALCEALPEAYIARSSTVFAELGEFERTSTAVISAYIGPVMRQYFARLDRRLREQGFRRDFLVVQSNAGAVDHHMASRLPATTITSGPAGGVNAAIAVAGGAGVADAISLDMGGTSADIAVAVGGKVSRAAESSLGFRLPLQVPMLDIATIGAGGGSIAWLDDAGILRVGPRSAGAMPGPACYGRGGGLATVTDAHLVLGHLKIDAMRENGLHTLDIAAADCSLRNTVADPLGIDVPKAAEAVLEVVNENMAGQIRLVTIDKGLDVRRFHLVAFGGAGPLHACALIRKLGMLGAVIPVFPGITSALGCTLCATQHDFAQTIRRRLVDLRPGQLREIARQQRVEGERLVARQGITEDVVTQDVSLTMLYERQRHTITVDVPLADLDRPQALFAAFEDRYRSAFGAVLALEPVVVSVRSSIMAPLDRLDLSACFTTLRADSRRTIGEAPARFNGREYATRIVPRGSLAEGAIVEGPAIVTQRDSTTLVEPGFAARVATAGALIVERR